MNAKKAAYRPNQLVAVVMVLAFFGAAFCGYEIYLRLTGRGFEYYEVKTPADFAKAADEGYMFAKLGPGYLLNSGYERETTSKTNGVTTGKSNSAYALYYALDVRDVSEQTVMVIRNGSMPEEYIADWSAYGRILKPGTVDKQVMSGLIQTGWTFASTAPFSVRGDAPENLTLQFALRVLGLIVGAVVVVLGKIYQNKAKKAALGRLTEGDAV